MQINSAYPFDNGDGGWLSLLSYLHTIVDNWGGLKAFHYSVCRSASRRLCRIARRALPVMPSSFSLNTGW
jgi:hypothetical protein